MASFLCVAILLSINCAVFCVVVRCPEEGCGNLTLYLGPKWGSKVIVLSQLEEESEQHNPEVIDPLAPEIVEVDSVSGKRRTTTTTTTTAASKSSNLYRPLWWNRPTVTTTKRYDRYYDRPWRKDIPTEEYGQPWRIFNRTNMRWEFQSPSRVELNLSGTNITGNDLKVILSQLTEENRTQLHYLYLSNNNISDLPIFTFPLEFELNLKELSLDRNPMRYLTSNTLFEISRLHYLQKLNLSRTGIMYFDCPYLPSLEVLDISKSMLPSVPSNLERLPNLRQLILNQNFISYLYDFPHMYNLQILSLSFNSLSYFRETTFQALSSLYALDLTYNSIKNVSQVNVSHYTTVHLKNNPLECSCPLLDIMKNSSYIVADYQSLMCVPTEGQYPWKAIDLRREDVSVDCPTPADPWDWVRDRAEQVEDVGRWFRRRGIHMYTIYNTAIWIIFFAAVIFVACLFLRRQSKEKPLLLPPTDVPYTVLDDKMLA